MLITFQSTSYGRLVYFEGVAKALLTLMGRRLEVPSAMYAEDVPMALARLQEGIGRSREEFSTGDDDPGVPLGVRAQPLIELMESAIANEEGLMWTN